MAAGPARGLAGALLLLLGAQRAAGQAITYIDMGSGQCQNLGYSSAAYTTYVAGISEAVCQQRCSADATCSGYAESTSGNCMLYMSYSNIGGGGIAWGSARCMVKQVGPSATSTSSSTRTTTTTRTTDFMSRQETVVSDGSQSRPYCTWWTRACTWNSTTQLACAQKLCQAAGFSGGTFVNASNDMCSSSVTSTTVWYYIVDKGTYEFMNLWSEAQITASCSNTPSTSTKPLLSSTSSTSTSRTTSSSMFRTSSRASSSSTPARASTTMTTTTKWWVVVASTTTTMTTTIFNPDTATQATGNVLMTVADPDTFIADPAANRAMTEMMASLLRVQPVFVHVDLVKAARRRLDTAAGGGGVAAVPRRLPAANVDVQYTVYIPDIPVGLGTTPQLDTIVQIMAASSPSDLQYFASVALGIYTDGTYSAALQVVGSTSVSVVVPTTTTTTTSSTSTTRLVVARATEAAKMTQYISSALIWGVVAVVGCFCVCLIALCAHCIRAGRCRPLSHSASRRQMAGTQATVRPTRRPPPPRPPSAQVQATSSVGAARTGSTHPTTIAAVPAFVISVAGSVDRQGTRMADPFHVALADPSHIVLAEAHAVCQMADTWSPKVWICKAVRCDDAGNVIEEAGRDHHQLRNRAGLDPFDIKIGSEEAGRDHHQLRNWAGLDPFDIKDGSEGNLPLTNGDDVAQGYMSVGASPTTEGHAASMGSHRARGVGDANFKKQTVRGPTVAGVVATGSISKTPAPPRTTQGKASKARRQHSTRVGSSAAGAAVSPVLTNASNAVASGASSSQRPPRGPSLAENDTPRDGGDEEEQRARLPPHPETGREEGLDEESSAGPGGAP